MGREGAALCGARYLDGQNKFIVPLAADGPSPRGWPRTLRDFQVVDVRDGNVENVCAELSRIFQQACEVVKESVQRQVRWFSTPDSIDAGEVTILAVFEACLAVGIYDWAALAFGSVTHIAIGLVLAPLMLVRPDDSLRAPLRRADPLAKVHWRFREHDARRKFGYHRRG
jgi:hypothetical protein